MESNLSQIMGHSKTPGVGIGVQINGIKTMVPEAEEMAEKFALFKKGGYRGKIPKQWNRFALKILET